VGLDEQERTEDETVAQLGQPTNAVASAPVVFYSGPTMEK
jgi:hypothetical protein